MREINVRASCCGKIEVALFASMAHMYAYPSRIGGLWRATGGPFVQFVIKTMCFCCVCVCVFFERAPSSAYLLVGIVL